LKPPFYLFHLLGRGGEWKPWRRGLRRRRSLPGRWRTEWGFASRQTVDGASGDAAAAASGNGESLVSHPYWTYVEEIGDSWVWKACVPLSFLPLFLCSVISFYLPCMLMIWLIWVVSSQDVAAEKSEAYLFSAVRWLVFWMDCGACSWWPLILTVGIARIGSSSSFVSVFLIWCWNSLLV
jgi:hypothetical protein